MYLSWLNSDSGGPASSPRDVMNQAAVLGAGGTGPAPFNLHHVGIVTPRERYEDVVAALLGILSATLEDELEDEPLDIEATWIRLSTGPRFEVVAPKGDADSPVTRFLSRTGGGLHHVSFDTTVLATCKAMATGQGARIIGESSNHGGWAEFFVDPAQTGGALLHWMQALNH